MNRNIESNGRRPMRRWVARGGCAVAACLLVLASALPARADYCVQLTGGPFSGDLGFFRFKGVKPTAAGTIVTQPGRVAGVGPVFGTAIVARDGSYLEIGATFFADATQGQIDLSFFPPTNNNGSGHGRYGAYGTSASFTAKKVGCNLEP
jgi:hypothetical protein